MTNEGGKTLVILPNVFIVHMQSKAEGPDSIIYLLMFM